jgi:hypothetical protein
MTDVIKELAALFSRWDGVEQPPKSFRWQALYWCGVAGTMCGFAALMWGTVELLRFVRGM